jgi:uncharacterized protein YjbI with pentapeptide repeats
LIGPTSDLPIRGTDLLFKNALVKEVAFQRGNVPTIAVFDSVFESCDFSDARLGAGSLGYDGQSKFISCPIYSNANVKCRSSAMFASKPAHSKNTPDRWLCLTAEFIHCTFVGDIEHVVFSGRPWGPMAPRVRRQVNLFIDNDFTRANLTDCSFQRSIDLHRQSLPDGNRYVRVADAARRVNVALQVVANWPNGDLKRRVLAGLNVHARIAREQSELFVRRDELGGDLGQDANDAIHNLMIGALS